MAELRELEDGWTWANWVYAGQRLNAKDKPVHLFIDGDDGEHAYAAKRSDSYAIGSHYHVPTNDEGAARLAWATFDNAARVGGVDARIAGWILEDRATRTYLAHAAAEKAAKRSESESLGNMTLAEARRFIDGAFGTNRSARVAVVMQALGL